MHRHERLKQVLEDYHHAYAVIKSKSPHLEPRSVAVLATQLVIAARLEAIEDAIHGTIEGR